jgi:hypothetical protein
MSTRGRYEHICVQLLLCSSLLIGKEGGHMPPQVSGPGPGKGPVVVHSQDGVNETKSGNLKKTSENKQDATNSSAPHRATPKEKSQKNLEMSMGIGGWLVDVGKALGDALTGKQSEEDSSEARTTKSGKGQGSWMTDLAKALGEVENQQAEKVKARTNKPVQSEADSAELKGQSEELNATSNALHNAVKVIGDAISTAARK